MEERKNLADIGAEILSAAQSELYMSFPYLDAALWALRPVSGSEVTLLCATDGERLYYNAAFLAERYLRGGAVVNRLYLHTVLHCLFRHLEKKRGRDGALWDLACDAAVESVLDSLPDRCIAGTSSPAKQKFLSACRRELRVLTAEGIYCLLLRDRPDEYELARLSRAFLSDDHGLWDPSDGGEEQRERQDRAWQRRAERAETGMETVLAGKAEGGGSVLEQLRVSAREDVDYRAFLRRFAAPREVLRVDGDAFDYIYYTYGLSRYGNMPLVEPPETKEEKRVEDLVVAIDTSMSTSGALVREFLRCTYAILRSEQTFTRRFRIRVLQCDDALRSDVCLHSREELEAYMEALTLTGGGATDFRPVFEHVEKLRQEGAFTNLRGLIYFTDGMGIYPQKRTPYETAFVLLGEPPASFPTPPWAVRLVLEAPDLERAAASCADWDGEQDAMPEL